MYADYVPEVRWYTCTFITHRASIIRCPKPNREQRAQARAAALLTHVTATSSARRGGRGASPVAGRTLACSLLLPRLRGAIARRSAAASHHGLAAGQRPWPVRRCCGGHAPLPAACRARWRAVTAGPPSVHRSCASSPHHHASREEAAAARRVTEGRTVSANPRTAADAKP